MKYSTKEKLKITNNALCIIVEKIEESDYLGRIFGFGLTGTDIIAEAMKQSEYEFNEEKKKRIKQSKMKNKKGSQKWTE